MVRNANPSSKARVLALEEETAGFKEKILLLLKSHHFFQGSGIDL